MEDENLTVEQVAKILKVSRQTVWVRCKAGKLPAFKMPGSRLWLVSRKELDKLQEKMRKRLI
jgi:excisionase family DNA binding protein